MRLFERVNVFSGCKIKALRAKTNTYIKTPARGDEPVFVVTGRQEDVAEVKREILSAAEHFSQIRASRRNAAVGESPRCPAVGTAEQVREKVPVPFWVVGLVVGPKGTTIRRIQQDTQTYIITPGKEKEPVFEILGTTENVNRARQEIESYIALRMRPRHNHMGLGGSWTKLDGHVDALCPLQQQASLRSSFQVKSNGCLSDAKLSESLDGRYAPPNWRQLPGCTGRPLSVDVAAFIRRVPTEEESFPSMERNRFFHEKNMDVPQKSFLGLEALISNCLSDLNLSENVLQSFIHHETSPDLRPSPATRCGSKMPFALRPLQADVVEFRDELTIPFDGLESDPLP